MTRARIRPRLAAAALVAGSAALALAAATPGDAVSAMPPVVAILTDAGLPTGGTGGGTWRNAGTTSPVVASAMVADGTCDPGIAISPGSFTLTGAGSSTPFTVSCAASAEPRIRRCQFHARRGDGQTLGSVTALCANATTTQLAYAGASPRDLGAPMVGTDGAFVPLAITNDGAAMSRISIHLADQDGHFKLGTPCAPGLSGCTVAAFNVGMGNTFTIDVQCTPQAAGPLSTLLYVVGGNGARLAAPIALTCNGTAVPGVALGANPAQVTLHAPINGQATTIVRITNGGGAPATITSLQVVGLHASEWTVMPDDPCTTGSCTLGTGGAVEVALRLAPLMTGTRMSTLRVSTAVAGQTLDVPLLGIGDQGVLAFDGALEQPFDLGTFPIGVTGGRTLDLRNNGNVELGPIRARDPGGQRRVRRDAHDDAVARPAAAARPDHGHLHPGERGHVHRDPARGRAGRADHAGARSRGAVHRHDEQPVRQLGRDRRDPPQRRRGPQAHRASGPRARA